MNIPPERFIAARVCRVHTPRSIDADMELGFGVILKRRVCIVPAVNVADAYWEKSKHCLIILIGGHDVLVRCDTAANLKSLVDGNVYIPLSAAPEAYQEDTPHGRLLNVGKYMQYLESVSFSVDTVKNDIAASKTRSIA